MAFKTRNFAFSFLLLVSFSPENSHASDSSMVEAYKKFKTGDYAKTVEILGKVRGDRKLMASKFYLEGVTQSKLQEFDLAAAAFEKAVRSGNTDREIYYEYGQALYGANELERAKKVFLHASKGDFKKWTSLYYAAHISQILEDWKTAKNYYQQIINAENQNVDKNTLQVARFQMGETLLSMARENPDKERQTVLVSKYILPQFKQAVIIDDSSTLSKDIKKREVEIMQEYGLDPNKFVNGRGIPLKKWMAYVSQSFSYDNNITFSSDTTPTVRATQKDSNILTTEAHGERTFILGRRFSITPDLTWSLTYHQDRDSPEVFANDQYYFAGTVNTSYEHTAFKNPASLIFGLETDYTARDRESIKDISFYGRSYAYSLGWRGKLFESGESTFRIKNKSFTAYLNTLDSETLSVSFDLLGVTKGQNMFLLYLSYDDAKVEDPSTNATSYLARFDFIIPEVYTHYVVSWNISATMIDNYNDTSKPNADMSYNAGLKITKNINRHFKIDLSYDYTKATSDDTESSQYTKHVSGMKIKYTF